MSLPKAGLDPGPRLQQPQSFEARVLAAPDHEMIVNLDLERVRRRRELARHQDVAARRRRVCTLFVYGPDIPHISPPEAKTACSGHHR